MGSAFINHYFQNSQQPPLLVNRENLQLPGDRAAFLACRNVQHIGMDEAWGFWEGEYQKRADELAAEYNRVDAELKAVEAEIQKRQSCGRRIETLVVALETAGEDFTVSLWGSMVEKLTVFEDALVFTLTSGEDIRVAPC